MQVLFKTQRRDVKEKPQLYTLHEFKSYHFHSKIVDVVAVVEI